VVVGQVTGSCTSGCWSSDRFMHKWLVHALVVGPCTSGWSMNKRAVQPMDNCQRIAGYDAGYILPLGQV